MLAVHDYAPEIEARHWWFAARRALATALLDRFATRPLGSCLVDLGCGAGGMLPVLERYGPAIGIDEDPLAVAMARKAGEAELGDIRDLPYPTGSTRVATLFDVLEHLLDPESVLEEARRVLAPGGLLIVTVPASPSLYSGHDARLGHLRRYDRQSLAGALIASGFVVLHLGGVFVLPGLAARLVRAAMPTVRTRMRLSHLNPVLRAYAVWEARQAARYELPGGLSLVAVAMPQDRADIPPIGP